LSSTAFSSTKLISSGCGSGKLIRFSRKKLFFDKTARNCIKIAI
jgi:hypothetical protein